MKSRRIFLPVWLVITCLAGWSHAAEETELALHQRIDRIVDQATVGQPVSAASDEEFLRRVYLDLTGRIPTVEQAREFIADPSSDKRAALIDRLLASPQHVRHMTLLFDVMLMERRAEKYVPAAEWRQYLYESFAANKPLHQLASEILAADGSKPEMRAASRFYLEREGEPNLLTRDVGRIFFGQDLQCAQCHDHPIINDYYQRDYYGLFGFFGRTVLFLDANDNNKAYLAENAEGDVNFKSVFTEEEGATRPFLPGEAEIEEPVFAKGDEYLVKPDKNVRQVPKYSRRQKLAELVARGENLALRRNLANRLWSILMGRGLVDPLDLHHSDNPPLNAQLLDLLADELAAMNFDSRAFLREIALSQTYQRSFVPPADWRPQAELAAGRVTELEQEQTQLTAAREAASEAEKGLRVAHAELRQQLAAQRDALAAARLAAAEADFAARTAQSTLAATQQQIDAKTPVLDAVQAAATAADKAAQLLADDPDVAAAAAKFQSQLEKLAAELAALQNSLPEQQQATVEKNELLANAQSALNAATEAYETAAQPLGELDVQHAASVAELRTASNAVAVARRRAATARTGAEVTQLLAAVAQSQTEEQRAAQQLADVQQRLATLDEMLVARQTELTQLQVAQQQAATEAATLARQLGDQRSAVELVTLAVSQVQQAGATLPSDAELIAASETLVQQQQRLSQAAEQLQQQQLAQSERHNALDQQIAAAQTALSEHQGQRDSAQQQLSQLETQHVAARTAHEAARAAADESLIKIEQAWTEQLALAPLQPLTPEQLGWSILQGTGVLANYRAATAAELKAKPEMAALASEQFEVELEKAVYAKLEPSVNEFVRLFGAGPGQPQDNFFATVDQALFFANGGTLRSWITPSGDNLTARMMKLDDPAQMAEELYWTVLTRRPTSEEVALVASTLAAAPDQKDALVQELAWALFTSAEFRFCP